MRIKTTGNGHKESARLEAFSDGIFAIAITLLVLDLITMLHPPSDEGIIYMCLHHWQAFLAFTVGFITIMVCWINHHAAMVYVKAIDTPFVWITGFLLFVVTLIPFSTAVLAEYLETESNIALAVFGFNYILISIAADSICTYAFNHHLIDDEKRTYYRNFKRIYRYAIFYTAIAFILCFFWVVIPLIMYVILFAVFAAPKTFAEKISKPGMKRKNK